MGNFKQCIIILALIAISFQAQFQPILLDKTYTENIKKGSTLKMIQIFYSINIPIKHDGYDLLLLADPIKFHIKNKL